MKTDALFYQVFQFDPQALFQLLQLPVEGEYTYESITIKTTEKRMDGFFKRIDGEGPNVFLEVQGLCCVASYVAFNQRPQRYPGKRYKKHHITFCYIVKFINNCTFLIPCVKLSGVFVSLVSTSLNADS